MTDILDLPGWQVLRSEAEDGEYVITGEFIAEPNTCLKCGKPDALYRHGRKLVSYRDSPIRGLHARLLARVQRYRCRSCTATFLQPLDGIEPARRMTQRCREYIEQQGLRDTFSHVATHVGCDEKTVRLVTAEHIKQLNKVYKIETPQWLGMDEVHVAGQLRCILTDVGKRAPVDMLSGRGAKQVGPWLQSLPNKQDIVGVTIDMWRPYRDLACNVLPHAVIVVDKFHVLAMVNRSLDRVRKALRGRQTAAERRKLMRSRHLLQKNPENLTQKQAFALGMWLDNVPELAIAYRLKETFYGIYGLRDPDDAEYALREWLQTVPGEHAEHFKEITTAVTNWMPEILNYFTHPFTNAYTEALNGVTKVVNRKGRGYTFDVLRARVLFMNYTPPEKPVEVTIVRQANELKAFLIERNQGECVSCGGQFTALEMRMSHIEPHSQTGKADPANVLLLCPDCHRRSAHEVFG